MACCVLIAALFAGLAGCIRAVVGHFGISLPGGAAWRPAPHSLGAAAVEKPRYPAIRAIPLQRLWRSIGFALEGLSFVTRTQPNMRVHLLAGSSALGVALVLGFERTEWLWLIAAILAVLGAECLNTAIEQLCDVVCPEPNLGVKRAKDTAAGMVLIAALGAMVIGAVLFLPKIHALLLAPPSFPVAIMCGGGSP